MALELDKSYDIAEYTIDGDDADNNNVPVVALATAAERAAMIRFKTRADVWIFHPGLDKDNAAANHSVYVINQGEDHTKSFCSFDNTATRANPYLFEDLPNASILRFFCAPGTSAKVEVKVVLRSEGRRASA